MSSSRMLGSIDQEWRTLLAVAISFVPGEQTTDGAVGHWSVKEPLLHVAASYKEVVENIRVYLDTREETDYGDEQAIDRLTEEEVEEHSNLSLDGVCAYLQQSHQYMMAFIVDLQEELLISSMYVRETVEHTTFAHYREHREDLERFKESRK